VQYLADDRGRDAARDHAADDGLRDQDKALGHAEVAAGNCEDNARDHRT
jgi:hypothetical protein